MSSSTRHRRRLGKPAPWTDEELLRLREGYEHGCDRINKAHAIALGAVLEDLAWNRGETDDPPAPATAP